MSKKLHRNGSFRLHNYDYGRNGFYFVTICSKLRTDDFGKIIDGEMKNNNLGKMAKLYWENIPKHFPFVLLDEFVVMPDHMHGIIMINKTEKLNVGADVGNVGFVGARHKNVGAHNLIKNDFPVRAHVGHVGFVGARHGSVGAHNYARLQKRPILYKNKFGPQSQNLGSIIRSYKISVQTFANKNNIPFAWQPRYYDRIIRNEWELNNIRRYIRNNPKMWHNQQV